MGVPEALLETNIIPKGTGTGAAYKYLSLALRNRTMFPKIPQLKRENASLRHPGPQDPPIPQEAGTNQKIPQTPHFVSAKKVWWDDQKKNSQHDVKEEEKHDAQREQHS